MNFLEKINVFVTAVLALAVFIYVYQFVFLALGDPFDNNYSLPAEIEFNSKDLKIYGYYKIKGESSLVLQDDAGEIYRTSCVRRWIDAGCIITFQKMGSKEISPWNEENQGKNVRVRLIKVKSPWYIAFRDDFYLMGSIEGDAINLSRDDINRYNMKRYPLKAKIMNTGVAIGILLYLSAAIKIIFDFPKNRVQRR